MAYDRGKPTEQPYRIVVEASELVFVKDGEFEGLITATLTKGGRAIKRSTSANFHRRHQSRRSETDRRKRQGGEEFQFAHSARAVTIDAQVVGFATRDPKIIELPWPALLSKDKNEKSKEEKDLTKEVRLTELKKSKAQLDKEIAEILKAKAQIEKEESMPKRTPTYFKVYTNPTGPAKDYYITIEAGDEIGGIKEFPLRSVIQII